MERCPSWPKEHDWKSCRRQKRLAGSNPALSAILDNQQNFIFFFDFKIDTVVCFMLIFNLSPNISGSVAQSVEQRTENPRVGGSIPSRTTIYVPV